MRIPSLFSLSSLAIAIALALAASADAGGILKPGTQSNDSVKKKPEFVAPAARKPVEGDGDDVIQARLHNAELEVREAHQNTEAAEWGYNRARTRRYPRGEALQALRDRRDSMRQDRDVAEQSFTRMVDEARRSGVPIGTLSNYMDLVDEIERQRKVRADTPEP